MALVLHDIHILNPMYSRQWYAELWWWTKFLVLSPLWIDIDPLPLTYLENEHSSLKVVEVFPETDPQALDKFLSHTNVKSRENNDKIVIMRNFWAHSDTVLKDLNTIENMKKYLDLDQSYNAMVVPKHKKVEIRNMTLDEILKDLPNTEEKLTMLSFTFPFLWSQDFFLEEYKKIYESLGSTLDKVMRDRKYVSSSFLYWGSIWRTRLHSGPASAFLLQIANSKKWNFIHKRYTPYVGAFRYDSGGVIATPIYWADDFPGHIPITEVTMNPGDMIWFGKFHLHDVYNIHDDKMGFAVSVRPVGLADKFAENVLALKLYSISCLPGFLWNKIRTKGLGLNFGSDCEGSSGKNFGVSYNGTMITRYDFKQTADGECLYQERRPDYQEKELTFEIKTTSYEPRFRIGGDNTH